MVVPSDVPADTSSQIGADVASIHGIQDLWHATHGDPNVSVAVLDGPVDLSHPCFSGATLSTLPATTSSNSDVGPASRHGTHVASVIFGQHISLIKGVAPACRGLIRPIFADAPDGSVRACSQRELADAINEVVDAGANIINISGGQPSSSGQAELMLAKAVERCNEEGVVIVAAAGNRGCKGLDACDCVHIPGAIPSVLAVGAMNERGQPLDFSNCGSRYRTQGILALGENILGALPGGSATTNTGTSFATPIVSGVLGLLMSLLVKRGESPDGNKVRAAILESAQGCENQADEECKRILVGRLNVAGTVSRFTRGENNMSDTTSVTPAQVDGQNGQASDTASSSNLTAERREDVGQRLSPPLDTGRTAQGETRTAALVSKRESNIQLGSSIMPARVYDSRLETTNSDPNAVVAPAVAEGWPQEVTPSQSTQFVYAIGRLDFDFGTEATRDSLQFHADGDKDGNRLSISDPTNLLRHLRGWNETYLSKTEKGEEVVTDEHSPHMYDATSILWTLWQDSAPIYAIQPYGPFAEQGYRELTEFLLWETGIPLDFDHRVIPPKPKPTVDRVAVGGVLAGSVQLLTGHVVSVIVPHMRSTAAWNVGKLIEQIEEDVPGIDSEKINSIILRLQEETRNHGLSAEERALNFMATNVFQLAVATRDALKPNLELDEVTVQPSPICRQDSECYDVDFYFYDPDNLMSARRVISQTVDVTGVVPVPIGPHRMYSRR